MTKAPEPERMLYSVEQFCERNGGISHATFYNLLARGQIRIVKIGRRTFVHRDVEEAFHAGLPVG